MDGIYKPRGRVNGFNDYGNESSDGLTELNKGPRAGRNRNLKGFVPNGTIAARGQGLPANSEAQGSVVVPEKDQYNKADFPETYSDAKFFIIKSYSEDDIHKCIKYNVWASTPHGNKKLDAAYQEATDKSSGCPVFLFFSVIPFTIAILSSINTILFLILLIPFTGFIGEYKWTVCRSCRDGWSC